MKQIVIQVPDWIIENIPTKHVGKEVKLLNISRTLQRRKDFSWKSSRTRWTMYRRVSL